MDTLGVNLVLCIYFIYILIINVINIKGTFAQIYSYVFCGLIFTGELFLMLLVEAMGEYYKGINKFMRGAKSTLDDEDINRLLEEDDELTEEDLRKALEELEEIDRKITELKENEPSDEISDEISDDHEEKDEE